MNITDADNLVEKFRISRMKKYNNERAMLLGEFKALLAMALEDPGRVIDYIKSELGREL